MNKTPITALVAAVLASGFGLNADVMTVSVDGFADPTTFTALDASLDLRVAELVPTDGANASTHVLIEGLSPIEEGTMDYTSTYSGINVDSGETQDVGILYLKMPEGSELPLGVVASPVVGVVQRSGSWADYNLDYPLTSVGNSSGDGDYGSGTLSMTLIRGNEAFIGNTSYTVLDQDTIEIDPFTLAIDGGASTSLSGATLMRDGDRYYGTVTNLSDGAAYDSLIFTIEFSNIPDLDNDGIPDIGDGEVVAGLIPGQYNLTSIGYVWGYTQNIGYSLYMGYIYMQMPYVYHYTAFGWFYYADSIPLNPGTAHWFYSQSLGWVYVNDTYGGFFQAENKGWAFNNFLSPTPW
jgi:hypothetical protein